MAKHLVSGSRNCRPRRVRGRQYSLGKPGKLLMQPGEQLLAMRVTDRDARTPAPMTPSAA